MTRDVDWELWRATWQAPADEATSAAVDTRDVPEAPGAAVRAAMQAARRARIAETAWLVVAITTVALALAHAPTADDVLVGGVTVALMLGATYLHWRATIPATAFAYATTTFLALALDRLEHVRRGLRLAWLLVALDLLFFVRWWADGVRHHPSRPGGLVVVTAALPLAVLVGFAGWLLYRGRGLRAELGALRAVERHVLDVARRAPEDDGGRDTDV